MRRFGSDPSGTIAMFIAAALQYRNPPCNGGPRRISTIKVDQHKNKFNQVVVYCTLAEADEVAAAWRESNGVGEPSSEFKQKCLINDAKHYRACYLDMLWLVPQHRDIIMSRADYPLLLKSDASALDELLEFRSVYMDRKYGEDPHLLTCWGVTNMEELRALLHKICNFK